MSGLSLLAAFGVLATAATPVCEAVWASITRLRGAGWSAATSSSTLGVSRAAARVCLGLTCVSALAAAGALWLGRQDSGTSLHVTPPLPWGALWVYAFVLLVEWRLVGLRDAGRRVLAGLLLAGAGVLFLGIGLTAWTHGGAWAPAACPVGNPEQDLNGLWIRGVAALGLMLVPMAGIALGFNRAETPALSAAPASVAIAAWLEPALPALGWLPTTAGAGATLAVLFVVALIVLGLAGARGSRTTLGGLLACFALGVGGCILLGI